MYRLGVDPVPGVRGDTTGRRQDKNSKTAPQNTGYLRTRCDAPQGTDATAVAGTLSAALSSHVGGDGEGEVYAVGDEEEAAQQQQQCFAELGQ